jgi:hypothetical protein
VDHRGPEEAAESDNGRPHEQSAADEQALASCFWLPGPPDSPKLREGRLPVHIFAVWVPQGLPWEPARDVVIDETGKADAAHQVMCAD